MKKAISLLLLTSSTIFYGQSIMTPKSNSIEKKWIQNREYKMNWSIVKDTSKIELGTVTTKINKNKKHLMVITSVELKKNTTQWIDTTIADAKTLKPVYHSSYNQGRDMVIHYNDSITGYFFDKKKQTKKAIKEANPASYFDSNIYPLLIGWLPFKEGYSQDISVYDYNPENSGVKKASVLEVKSSIINVQNKNHDVWQVKVKDEISNGESTYYFDKKNRSLLKQVIRGNGRELIFTLI
ncbi:MAG TPA: hypothetical protein VJL37_12875 [Flavobacterium sp.]|nr:hypothetical protein [Flavobacterium sp.]